jgi:hypothetical protein
MTSFVGYNETSLLSIDPLKTPYCIGAAQRRLASTLALLTPPPLAKHPDEGGGDYSGKPAPHATRGAGSVVEKIA